MVGRSNDCAHICGVDTYDETRMNRLRAGRETAQVRVVFGCIQTKVVVYIQKDSVNAIQGRIKINGMALWFQKPVSSRRGI